MANSSPVPTSESGLCNTLGRAAITLYTSQPWSTWPLRSGSTKNAEEVIGSEKQFQRKHRRKEVVQTTYLKSFYLFPRQSFNWICVMNLVDRCWRIIPELCVWYLEIVHRESPHLNKNIMKSLSIFFFFAPFYLSSLFVNYKRILLSVKKQTNKKPHKNRSPLSFLPPISY